MEINRDNNTEDTDDLYEVEVPIEGNLGGDDELELEDIGDDYFIKMPQVILAVGETGKGVVVDIIKEEKEHSPEHKEKLQSIAKEVEDVPLESGIYRLKLDLQNYTCLNPELKGDEFGGDIGYEDAEILDIENMIWEPVKVPEQ